MLALFDAYVDSAPAMSAHASINPIPDAKRTGPGTGWGRPVAISVVLAFLILFLVVPLAAVFVEALRKGWSAYQSAVTESDVVSAIGLTLVTAGICVPLNTVFGIAAAWAIAKYDFPGRRVLLTLIELPLSVSPVIAGLIFVLLFGAHGWFGSWLQAHHVRILFALPGIVLATMFVTLSYVARELIPLMEAQGNEEEEAALTLGASPWAMFMRVTLPKIRWGLLYGVLLTNARAMGEFGAVSVVSGHVRGETNTIPLQVEVLYNEYQFSAAFAVASILSVLALLSLALQHWVEIHSKSSTSFVEKEES